MLDETLPEADTVLDARGLLCPMPIVKAAKAMRELAPGQVLRLLATDRGARSDVPAWAADTGNTLIDMAEADGTLVFLLRKGQEQ